MSCLDNKPVLFRFRAFGCHSASRLAVLSQTQLRSVFVRRPSSAQADFFNTTMGFVPYQVDYASINSAKTLGFTKKRVSFKFGFANPQSITSGGTGADCRGSEHEVVFVWSLTSGKRQLFLDGRDVHFSESGQNGWTSDRAWQHTFTMRDATGTYRVHFISQPKNAELPDSKPFDLRVAGVSYFAFNRVYQLGTPAMTVRMNDREGGNPRIYSGGGRESPMSPDERRQVAVAKAQSLRDMNTSLRSKMPKLPPPEITREEPNLLSFDEDINYNPHTSSSPATGMLPSQTLGAYNQFASSMSTDSSYGIPVGQQPSSGQPSPTLYGQPLQHGYGETTNRSYGSEYSHQLPVVPSLQAQASAHGSDLFRGSSITSSVASTQIPYGQPSVQKQSSYPGYGSSYPNNNMPAETGSIPAAPGASSLVLTPYQASSPRANYLAASEASSPYALPLSPTPTSSSFSSAQQQQPSSQQQPFPPTSAFFASPGSQSYSSYGGSAAPLSNHPQPHQQNSFQLPHQPQAASTAVNRSSFTGDASSTNTFAADPNAAAYYHHNVGGVGGYEYGPPPQPSKANVLLQTQPQPQQPYGGSNASQPQYYNHPTGY